MSFNALMLLKNREAKIVKANATKSHFKYKNGIYIISEADIQNAEENKKILGAEAIYFEGNPSAVGFKEMNENSGKYLNEIVLKNALKQTASGPKYDFGASLAFLAPLKDPVNLMYLLFGLVIVYGLIAGALGWA